MYQFANFLLHFHVKKVDCKFHISCISGNQGGFFGYYDKSPESPDGRFVLYHRPCQNEDAVDVILKNRENNSEKIVSRTLAYNFQAGSRLHWIDTSHFVFNSYDPQLDNYVAVVYDCESEELITLPHAIYDAQGEKYLTVDFKNLEYCNSEYGYKAHKHTNVYAAPEIKLGYLNPSIAKTIFNVDMLRAMVPEAVEASQSLHFNHAMFNPSGSAFVFIARWVGKNGRKEILFHHEMNSNVTKVLNHEMTSHYCWIDDFNLLGYLSHNSKRGYYSINVTNLKFTEFHNSHLARDGHPTFKNGEILTDTYPDKSRWQHIYMYHNDKVSRVGRFFSPLRFNESKRCDLHPRFNFSGNRIYFDSMHEGRRNMYCINIRET